MGYSPLAFFSFQLPPFTGIFLFSNWMKHNEKAIMFRFWVHINTASARLVFGSPKYDSWKIFYSWFKLGSFLYARPFLAIHYLQCTNFLHYVNLNHSNWVLQTVKFFWISKCVGWNCPVLLKPNFYVYWNLLAINTLLK